jgi:hypothetical protein
VRAEMAEFIRMIRLEEAVNDEDEYWRNHPIEKLVLDGKTMIKKAIKKQVVDSDEEDDDGVMAPITDV